MQVVELANARTGETVCAKCELAVRPWSRMRGLLGRDALAADAGMLFSRTGSVHTYRMRFPIDVVFLDDELTVLSVNANLGRGKTAKGRGASWTLELPAGAAMAAGIAPGVTLSYSASPSTSVIDRRKTGSVGASLRLAKDERRAHAPGTMIRERAPQHEAPGP